MRFMLFALLSKEKSGADGEEVACVSDPFPMWKIYWIRWDIFL